MDQYELNKPDDEGPKDKGNEGYDDWYRLIGPESTPEEMPDAAQGEPSVQADADCDDEDRGPVPFGEDGAAFLRNVLQHGVFLGIGMLILMLLTYAHRR